MSPEEYTRLPGTSRRYKHITTGEEISLRQYQKIQRGGLTYSQYVKKRGGKKQYKTKGHVRVALPKTKKITWTELPKFMGRPKASRQDALDRVRVLKDSWARKRSEEYGIDLPFEQLPTVDQAVFWEAYHNAVDTQPPTLEEYEEELDDLFDLSFEDWLDLAYGDTP
jgi:hypothetical protein